ncbi:hypothetical protein CBR_g31810 [Chara braunii]|uniref:CCHC-type domain-containing protein n=1 Tax=Chara braunii TaxID=69332 RepID=A0A388LFP7_CHABU|nr:hypothetical protein CBR_g31810 [Chara braunii]|eukprot:GBG81134.1 hypothetical protein CBR_g31810 [Chara braunii]
MRGLARGMTSAEMRAPSYRDKPGSPYSLRWDRRNSDPWRSVGDKNPYTLADYGARGRDNDDPWRRRDDEIDRDRRGDWYRPTDGYYEGGRFEHYPRSPRYYRNPDGYRSPANFVWRDGGDSRGHWEPDGDCGDGSCCGYDRTDRGGDKRDDSRGRNDRGGYPASPGYRKSPTYLKSPGTSNQDGRGARGPAPRVGEERPPTPRNTCIYCKADDHVKRDCPDLKRAIDDGLVLLDDYKYIKWVDDKATCQCFLR